MNIEKATKDIWKNKTISNNNKAINFLRKFTKEEFCKIKKGFIPKSMEDHWFAYFAENILYFHNSWSGVCKYLLKINGKDDYKVVETIVNIDPNEIEDFGDEYNIATLHFLIDSLLLGKNVELNLSDEVLAELNKQLNEEDVKNLLERSEAELDKDR